MRKLFSAFLLCTMVLCTSLVSYGSDEAPITNSDEISYDMTTTSVEFVAVDVVNNFSTIAYIGNESKEIGKAYDVFAVVPGTEYCLCNFEVNDKPIYPDISLNYESNLTEPYQLELTDTKHSINLGSTLTAILITTLEDYTENWNTRPDLE